MNKVNHIITKTAKAGKTLLTATLLFAAANVYAQNSAQLQISVAYFCSIGLYFLV